MIHQGTVAEEYKPLMAWGLTELSTTVEIHLKDGWRLFGDLKIENRFSTMIPNTNNVHNTSDGHCTNVICYIQVMIR